MVILEALDYEESSAKENQLFIKKQRGTTGSTARRKSEEIGVGLKDKW